MDPKSLSGETDSGNQQMKAATNEKIPTSATVPANEKHTVPKLSSACHVPCSVQEARPLPLLVAYLIFYETDTLCNRSYFGLVFDVSS